MKKKKGAPWAGVIKVDMPQGGTVSVKLPSAEGVELGARQTVTAEYKGKRLTIRLVRIAGGWDVEA